MEEQVIQFVSAWTGTTDWWLHFHWLGGKKKKLMHEDKIQVRKLLYLEVRRHTVGEKGVNLK